MGIAMLAKGCPLKNHSHCEREEEERRRKKKKKTTNTDWCCSLSLELSVGTKDVCRKIVVEIINNHIILIMSSR